ncbi:hypothetical protein GPECTOR_67g301 [Gonium pectorale]|uniref:CAP-Gly domain-containing protein n=1 Tax=Gonium pectorale TaxID=33097 RepID=A0A150G3R7_GONPE|nr:hypothetical protein GPECTOR_67g301 [Gonium pectorale]|eukprot:KXZ44461.1 hypothetical protein GPECTOR_67g301 [Gonium pectorale]
MSQFMNREDVEALRAYVVGPDSGFANRADSTVLLHITHSNLKAKFMEIRLDLHATIESVKVKLSFHCGTSPSAMLLTLLDESGAAVATLWEDTRKLGFYSPRDGYTLHITDSDPGSASAGGWLEDTSLVEKYRISDEAYDKREKTYRKWKNEQLAKDPTWTLEKEMARRRGVEYTPPAPKVEDPDHMADLAAAISVGKRCSVDPGDRRGEVMFVGRVEGLPLGFWVGVRYDEPLGKNDGSVKGRKFFECPSGYGGFVRPDKVKVGDFPPIDEFASEGEEGLGDDEI